jgi:spermidine synthase
MHREFPETKHTVIEKNSAVIEAARRFFELPQDNRLRLLKADVTEIIPTLTEKFDIILLDAYTDFGAPEEVKRVEFLRNLRGCLNSTGWLAGNTWTMTGDFLEQCEIWKSTFTQVLQARANLKGNVILLGSQISQLPDKKNYQETAKILNKRHRLDFQKMLRELQAVV